MRLALLLVFFMWTASAGDMWLARRTDGLDGDGTQGDPRDASTTAKFDAIFTPPTPGTTYRLVAGDYTTLGSVWGLRGLTKGCRLIGDGMTTTTIRIDPTWTPADAGYLSGKAAYVVASLYDGELQNELMSDVVISDLTLDCNFTNITVQARNGHAFGHVYAWGRNTRVERVRFLSGHDANGPSAVECFAVALMGTNSVVSGCTSGGFSKNTGPGSHGLTFFSFGHYGTLENTVLDLSDVPSAGPLFYCAGVSFYRTGTTVRNCGFISAGSGMNMSALYSDTHIDGDETKGWLVESNQFVNVHYGVAAMFNAVQIISCTIRSNHFQINAWPDNTKDSGALRSDLGGIGVPSWNGVVFTGNTVTRSVGQSAIRMVANITNLFMSNNVFEAGMLLATPSNATVFGGGNLMSDGLIATNAVTGKPYGVWPVRNLRIFFN